MPFDPLIHEPIAGGFQLKSSPLSIRKITRHAFMQRFTQAERIAIRNSTDDIVIDIHESLKSTLNVMLDLQETIDSLSYLSAMPANAPILAAGRQAEILADGVESEI
jgi:hypothetical protein